MKLCARSIDCFRWLLIHVFVDNLMSNCHGLFATRFYMSLSPLPYSVARCAKDILNIVASGAFMAAVTEAPHGSRVFVTKIRLYVLKIPAISEVKAENISLIFHS